jgi:endonuclease YncB( thermonuclease family)
MLNKILLAAFVLAVASLQTVFSQGLINGTVVDVIDGRTLVVSNASEKKINVRLRYLEVPEPEQQLSDVVKNHLKDLALGKKIYVTKVQIFANYTLGVGMINERESKFDLTQQMIRDGAGWFDVYDASAASDESTSDYQETEQLAKNEKRGVWGIADMKTPWQYRDENNAKNTVVVAVKTDSVEKKPDEMSLAEMVKNSSKSTNGAGRLAIYDFESKTPKPVAETQGNATASKNTFDGSGPGFSSDLNQVYLAQHGKGYVTTRVYEFNIQNGKTTQKLALLFGYDYSIQNSSKSVSGLGLIVAAKMEKLAFLKGKNVALILDDGKKVSLGVGRYASKNNSEGVVFTNLNRDEVLSILESDSVTLVIGKFKKKIDDSYKQTIDNFVATLK